MCNTDIAPVVRRASFIGIAVVLLAPLVGRSGEPAPPQSAKAAEVTIPGTRQLDIASRVNRRQYRLFIAEPTGEKPAAGYPVIYLLDANAYFATLVEAARTQQRLAGPAVIVGVGYPTSASFDHARRYYDFTPKTPPERLTAGNIPGQPPSETGGQDEFLLFLEQDVKPLVEQQFGVDRSRQVLLGHSLGGLFVLHALFTRPEGFQTYVASSPSIWWNERSILAEEQAFVARLSANKPGQPTGKTPPTEAAAKGRQLRLPISVGELEQTPRPGDTAQRSALLKHNRMVNNARELSERLASLSQHGLRVTFAQSAEENHGSVAPMAISRAVRLGLRQEP